MMQLLLGLHQPCRRRQRHPGRDPHWVTTGTNELHRDSRSMTVLRTAHCELTAAVFHNMCCIQSWRVCHERRIVPSGSQLCPPVFPLPFASPPGCGLHASAGPCMPVNRSRRRASRIPRAVMSSWMLA
eukprot:1258138-Amphidinium_carterae.1